MHLGLGFVVFGLLSVCFTPSVAPMLVARLALHVRSSFGGELRD